MQTVMNPPADPHSGMRAMPVQPDLFGLPEGLNLVAKFLEKIQATFACRQDVLVVVILPTMPEDPGRWVAKMRALV
jgi:hypothetical protein